MKSLAVLVLDVELDADTPLAARLAPIRGSFAGLAEL